MAVDDIIVLNNSGFQNADIPEIRQDLNVFDNYWKGEEMRYRNKLFEYQKKKNEIDNRIKSLDFNTAGTWERDLPYITEKFNDVSSYAMDNPQAFNPTTNDISSMMEFNKKSNDVKYWATKSKADKAQYDLWKQKIITDADLKEHASEYLPQLESWAEQPVEQRGDFNFVPILDYNALEHVSKLAENKVFGETNESLGKPTASGVPYHLKIPTTKQYDPQKIRQGLEADWQNTDVKDHYTDLYNDPSVSVDKNLYPTPKDYYLEIEGEIAKNMGFSTGEKLEQFPTGNGSDTDNPEFNWIIDNAMALSDPNSQIFSEKAFNKSGKEIGKATHAFDGLRIAVGGKNADGDPRLGVVRALYNIKGKIYAATGTTESATGFTDPKDLIEITNRYNQLVTRYINQEYGSSPTTAKAIQAATNYAKDVDQKNELGLPRQSSIGEQKSQYDEEKTVKGVRYGRKGTDWYIIQ